MLKKATFFPSQPWPAETGLSTCKAAGPLGRGVFTAVRGHDEGPTRLHEVAISGRERLLAYPWKLEHRSADFFNILLEDLIDFKVLAVWKDGQLVAKKKV
jgi:hypothetical protein